MYTLILMPVLIIVVFLFFSTYSYTKNYKELLKNGYLEKLESICTQSENSLHSIETIIRFLTNSNEFENVASDADNKSAETIIGLLKQVKESNNFIDNICIYNRSSQKAYYNDGYGHASTYFFYTYRYAQYDKSYFDMYQSKSEELKILSPTIVNNFERKKTIIPMIFSPEKSSYVDILVIVNVNLSDIAENANNSKLTESSKMLIVNNQNRNIFTHDNEDIPKFENSFYTNVSKSKIACFDCKVDGKLSLVMAYTPDSSLLGYSYIAVVPYSDINSRTAKLTFIMLFIGIFVLIAVFIGAYFSARQIYNPIEDLASMFDNELETDENKNLLKKLHSAIRETLTVKDTLQNEYTKVLPLVQERYLINYLDSNKNYVSEEEDVDLPIDFTYEYFCSIVIKLNPTDEFYELYGKSEYNAIKSGINNIIESEFSERYEVYIVPSENDTLYVLLNLSDDGECDAISAILENFRNIMDYDKSYMNMTIGTGGIYGHVGFGTRNTFIRTFKRITGVTPSDYRKSHKKTL